MDNYADARQRMVEMQLRKRGIKNEAVLTAMAEVPRHFFVDKKFWSRAYEDSPLPIACSQTISQPYMVALMTELADPSPEKTVLEIGTGSGYQAAILAKLFKKVYTVERHAELAERAKQILSDLGFTNVEIKIDDGTIGWKEKAPFDAIIVTAAAPEIPDDLIDQLSPSGKLIIPVGPQFQQTLQLVERRSDSYITRNICGCVFVPLIGKRGWKE